MASQPNRRGWRTSLAGMDLPRTRARATLPRALALLRDVRVEQTDPARFYGHLAEDTAGLVGCLVADCSGSIDDAAPALRGARVLDVGGGPGYFAEAFARYGAHYVGLEPDAGEMAAAGIRVAASVRGSGEALPFRDGAFDVVYSSNVAEHVPDPWAMGAEMLRVTRPSGLAVLSHTV